jgi:hypothetical protein
VAVLCLYGLSVLTAGCYHYRLAGQSVAAATEPRRVTLWSTLWGLSQQNINTDETCVGNPVAEVTTSTNIGYVLLTVVSLGFAAPVEVEWKCAKDRPGKGDDF